MIGEHQLVLVCSPLDFPSGQSLKKSVSGGAAGCLKKGPTGDFFFHFCNFHFFFFFFKIGQ